MTEWGEVLRQAGADEAVGRVWLRGLASNQALPGSVLKRLLECGELTPHRSWLTGRQLDAEATAIVVSSPHEEHRLDVAQNPRADVDALARLAHDVAPRVRSLYACLLGDFGRRVPAGAWEVLAADADPKVRRMLLLSPGMPMAVRVRLAEDEEPGVRAVALTRELWEELPEAARERVLGDPSPQVREKVAALLRVEEEPEALTAAARVTHPDLYVRRGAAGDPRVPLVLALRLADDPDAEVRLALSMREDLTEEQRASIPYELPDGPVPGPLWVQERGADPDTARRIAASAHAGLRRSIARRAHLPDEVVAKLATDEDPWVRRNLCDHCQDAPHELLLELYATVRDRYWSSYRYHRNFARPGLARFVDDPDPRLRNAALDDPEAGPELLLRLADDPAVSTWAVRDPRLPLDELLRRLTLPDSAFAAAANPALPPAWMHRLVDLAPTRGGSGG